MDTSQTPASAMVVFESMFGSTRHVAEAVAAGLAEQIPTTTHAVRERPTVGGCRLLVVGAPTHAHSLSRPSSRAEASSWARDRRRYTLEEGAQDFGAREWLGLGPAGPAYFAAFDTRADMPRIFAGSAAAAIARRLTRRGMQELVPAESFLVDRDSALLPGELDRARRWGRKIAALLPPG